MRNLLQRPWWQVSRPTGRDFAQGLILLIALFFGLVEAKDFVRVSKSWWVLYGEDTTLAQSKDGRIANIALVVRPKQALIIGAGVSMKHGQDILQAARKVTGKRKLTLLLTHAQQEFIMGASAFEQAGIKVHMPALANARMQERCGQCLLSLTERYGADAMRGSYVVSPITELPYFQGVHFIDHGLTSTAGISVYDVAGDVHFLAGLYSPKRVPELQEASPIMWAQAINKVKGKHFLTGHGPLRTRPEATYLSSLNRLVEEQLKHGLSLAETMAASELANQADWASYSSYHRRNVSNWFLQRESESF